MSRDAAVTDDHNDHADQNDTSNDEYTDTHDKVEIEIAPAFTERGSGCGPRSGSNSVCVHDEYVCAKEREREREMNFLSDLIINTANFLLGRGVPKSDIRYYLHGGRTAAHHA